MAESEEELKSLLMKVKVESEKEPETICLQAVEPPYERNRVLFVERSGELRWLARLSPQGTEPKGNQVLTGRTVSQSRPETG